MKKQLLGLVVAAIGLAAAPVSATPILDGYRVTLRHTTFEWSTTKEDLVDEVHVDVLTERAPKGFKGGIVALAEPGGGISDEFALIKIPVVDWLAAIFLSDPLVIPESVSLPTRITINEGDGPYSIAMPTRTMTIEETGGWQSVGKFFGFKDNDAVQVISDAAVPEPATLALLGAGLTGLAFTRRRARAFTGSAG